MSERFELSKDKGFIFDNLKDDFLDLEDDVNMLNFLCDENEQLGQEIVHLKDDLQYYKTKSARLEEELLSTRGCMYE